MINNNQLALTIQLNQQANLEDFCWENNLNLKYQIEAYLTNIMDLRFIYLWGGSGIGKSHILQGCCQAVNQHKTVSYLPLAMLREWGPQCLEGMDNHSFLAIDDIEAIAGRQEWEEALFHLYNRVKDNHNTTLMIAGKFAPTTCPIVLPDLRSRLSWGLTYQINDMCDDNKILVLQQHAQKRGFALSANSALFLIKRCSRSMHALQQVLEQLDQASLAAQRKITIPFIKLILNL